MVQLTGPVQVFGRVCADASGLCRIGLETSDAVLDFGRSALIGESVESVACIRDAREATCRRRQDLYQC